MADNKKTEVLYKATGRFFDWVTKEDGEFGKYMLFIFGIEKKQDPLNDPDVYRLEIAISSTTQEAGLQTTTSLAL